MKRSEVPEPAGSKIRMRGCEHARRGARICTPKPSGAPMRTDARERLAIAGDLGACRDHVGFHTLGLTRNRSPACVSSLPAVCRRKSFVFRADSSAARRRDTVAWLRPRRRAAPRICPERATARNMRTSSQFIRVHDRRLHLRKPALNASRSYQFLHNGYVSARVAKRETKAGQSPKITREVVMAVIGHFIGGKHVAGTSGRTTGIFQPMDGTVQGTVALARRQKCALQSRMPRQRSRLGRNQPAAPRARDAQVPRTRRSANMTRWPNFWRASMARPFPTPRAISSAVSKWSRSASALRIC